MEIRSVLLPGFKKCGKFVYILMAILQCVIYGVGNPISKIAYESITPLWCLAIRFTIAALIMAALGGRSSVAELRSALVRDWMPGVLCTAGAYILCNIALSLTTATSVGFLMSLSVLFVPALALIVLRRPYRWAFIPAQLTAAAGLYLLCSSGGSFSFGWGEVLALMVAIFIAGALVWGEKSLQSLSPFTLSFAQIIAAGALSMVGVLIFERGTDLSAVKPFAWWVVAYLAVFCSCIAYQLQNIALAHIPAGLVSLAHCSEPVFNAVAAFFILGESLSAVGLVGGFLLLVSIVYGNYIEKKNDTAPC